MVLEIDEDKRRISLGMKQCKANPWEEFAQNTKRGDRVKGPIKSITDFGVFVGLAAGIDGLVHLSDLSWNEPGEAAVRNYKKGQEVEAIVLAVDVDRERISLGIKQLDADPFTTFVSVHDKGSAVTGKVKTVDPKGAEIELGRRHHGLPACLAKSRRDRVEDARNVLKEGDEVKAVVVNIDRKTRNIQLSIKAEGHGRPAGSDGATCRSSPRARTPARPAWARCCAPSWTTRKSKQVSSGRWDSTVLPGCHLRHDPKRPRRRTGRPFRPAHAPRRRVRRQDHPRRDERCAGARAPHRDPRLRQLLDQPAPAAHGPQSALRRKRAHPEKRVPHFKPGKALREAVDERTAEIEARAKS